MAPAEAYVLPRSNVFGLLDWINAASLSRFV